MSAPDHYLKQGDGGVTIRDTLLDANSEPVDIDGATARFIVAPIEGGLTIIDEPASNDQTEDPTTNGKVSYTLQVGDTSLAGHFLGEWEVRFTGGAVLTFPNGGYVHLLITEQLAGGVVYS